MRTSLHALKVSDWHTSALRGFMGSPWSVERPCRANAVCQKGVPSIDQYIETQAKSLLPTWDRRSFYAEIIVSNVTKLFVHFGSGDASWPCLGSRSLTGGVRRDGDVSI